MSSTESISAGENSPSYFGWRVLAASVVGMTLSPGPLFWGSLGLFVTVWQADFGWSRPDIMLSLTVVTIASIPAMPVIGWLIDRFSVRQVLLPSIGILIVLLALTPVVLSSLFTLYLMFFLAGSLTVGTQSIAYIRALSSWFQKYRGLSIGITAAGLGLGYAIVPPIVQWAISSFGWKSAYWTLALIVAAVSVPMMFLYIKNKPHAEGTTNVDATGLSVGQAVRTREFWIVAVAILTVASVFNALLPTMVPLLTDRGLSRAEAVVAASTMGIAMTISRIGVGVLIDRIFAPYVACVVFVVASVGLLALSQSGASLPLAYTAAFLVGLGFGAETDLMGFLVGRYFGLRSFGKIYGIVLSCFLVGTGLGPYLFSLAAQQQGDYQQILVWSAVIGIVAAFSFLLLPRYPDQAFKAEGDPVSDGLRADS